VRPEDHELDRKYPALDVSSNLTTSNESLVGSGSSPAGSSEIQGRLHVEVVGIFRTTTLNDCFTYSPEEMPDAGFEQ